MSDPSQCYRHLESPSGQISLWAEDAMTEEVALILYELAKASLARAQDLLKETLDCSHGFRLVVEVAPFSSGAFYPSGIMLRLSKNDADGLSDRSAGTSARLLHEALHHVAFHNLSASLCTQSEFSFLLEGLPMAICARIDRLERRIMHLVAKGALQARRLRRSSAEASALSRYEFDGSLADFILQRHGLHALKEAYRALDKPEMATAFCRSRLGGGLGDVMLEWRRFLNGYASDECDRADRIYRASGILDATLSHPIVQCGDTWYREGTLGLQAESVPRAISRALSAYARIASATEDPEAAFVAFGQRVQDLREHLDLWTDARDLSMEAGERIARGAEWSSITMLVERAFASAARVGDQCLVDRAVEFRAICLSLERSGGVTEDPAISQALRDEARRMLMH